MQAFAAGSLLLVAGVFLAQQLLGGRASAATAHASAAAVTTQTFGLSKQDEAPRLVTRCPGSSVAYGGGMINNQPFGLDGEGIYPRSYERLGVQRGWHITVNYVDPSPASTAPRSVTVQAMCGPKLGHVTPPHKIVTLKPGQTKVAIAKCPGRRTLLGGGYQRTNFTTFGGVFAMESRAISTKAWRVIAHNMGGYTGQAVAIAYCNRTKRVLTQVEASVPVPTGRLVTATTPQNACPFGTQLINGGFSLNGSITTLFTDGEFNLDGTWSASAYDRGPPTTLTAYGYCLAI
jgi:hypothetical protein